MPALMELAVRLVPLGIFVALFVVGYLVRAALYRLLARWAAKSATQLDDIIIATTKLPSLFWILLLSALIALQLVEISEDLRQVIDKILVALLILSLTIVAARLLVALIQRYASRLPVGTALPMTGLTQTLTQWAVILIGMLILLSTLGINITPLLTALGIGGLAVALALQDTLSNLFAGLHVILARQVHPSQRIRLDSGEEGYVVDIGWRSTTLRTPSNHLIIIPNAKLAQSIVTNYNLPDPPVNIVIPIGVSYDSDPERVEHVLKDEAKRFIEELPGFIPTFEPIVRFQSFGEFSLNFLLIVRVESYDAQFGVWGQIHHRIFKRFQQEGIEIPFPVRTVHLKNSRHTPARDETANPERGT
jgi:small-conductance mechanosensitive channel